MLTVNIDEDVLNEIVQSEIQKHLQKLDGQQTFWNTEDLKKHTRMSWNTIQDTFFHEPGFPKAKVGGKWLYPAEAAKQFLLDWLNARVGESS